MRFQQKKVALALAHTLAGGALSALVMAPAFAQAPSGQAPIRVEVTGSNIPRTDTETPSPVQVLTAADLAASGYTTISEVLRDVTANGQGLLSQGFNGAFAGGASGVALRGLGVGATLVLVDGFRMVPYPLPDDAQRAFTDISAIPFSAVERIEIVLDGASAIYGSDAIGGVVNVILKKEFQGVQLLAEGGTTAKGDGNNFHVSLTTGFKDDSGKYSAFIAAEYRHQDSIMFSDRSGKDWANQNWAPYGGIDLRPGTRSTLVTNPILRTPYLQKIGSSSTDPTAFAFLDSRCDFAKRQANECQYDNTWSTIQPETQNINLLGVFNAQLSKEWQLRLTGSWFDSKSEQNRRPFAVPAGSVASNLAYGPGMAPVFVGNGIPLVSVPANYPGNTLGVPAIVRALVPDISNQKQEYETQTTRIVAELNGSVAGWELSLAGGYELAATRNDRNGYVNYNYLYAALNDPVNPYKLTGGNSAAVNAQVAPTVSDVKKNELDFAQFTATRDLMKLDGGSLGLALGASYVYQKLKGDNPYECKTGTVFGINCFYAVGDQSNTAVFAEISAPVMKTLELNAAVRYDYYDTYGGQWTPKFGAKWTPLKQVAIRGTWGQGFRAPYITENGDAGAAFTAGALRDPLNCPVVVNGKPDLTSPQNVPVYCSFGPTHQQGTTKDLKPEKSTNWTIGAVVEPVPDWSVTADYYSIELKDQIVPASSSSDFDQLAYAVRTPPQLVTFGDGRQGISPAGIINYINEGYINAQTTTTTGLDFQTNYAFKLPDDSRLKLSAQWSHIFTYDITFEGVKYKLAGTHGPAIVSGNTGNPRDRVQLSAQWTKGPFTGTLMGNYVSGYNLLDPAAGSLTCDEGAAYGNPNRWPSSSVPSQFCNVDSFWYWNLNLAYQVNKQTNIRFAVTNLFNQQAPVDVGAYAGAGDNRATTRGAPYNPSLHWAGVIGTSFLLGVTYTF